MLSNFNDDELKLVNIKLNEITQDIEKLVFKKEDKKIIEIQNSTKKINILTKIKNIMNNEQ